jgi:MFS family permease
MEEERTYTRGPLRGLTPGVVRLGLVSFFADVSSEMLYPLTPIFLTSVLGAPASVVGLIEGSAEAVASLLKSASGWLSDRTGRRRPFVLGGYVLSAFAKPLLAFAHVWPTVLVARVTDRFGKGLRDSPRDALLADATSADSRGRAFGWHRAMDSAGAVIGPGLALGLVALMHEQLRPVFVIAFIPGIIGAALVLGVRERRRPPVPGAGAIGLAQMPPRFRGFLLGWGLFALANSSDVFLILRARQLASTVTVVAMYSAYNLTYALASPVLGHLSDRLGRGRVLVGGLGTFALVYLGFALVTRTWQLWVLFAVYGLYIAATESVTKATAVDLVPAEVRGGAIGLLGTVSGLSALVASGVAGILWTAIGPGAAFAYGAAGAIVGAVVLASRLGLRAEPAV